MKQIPCTLLTGTDVYQLVNLETGELKAKIIVKSMYSVTVHKECIVGKAEPEQSQPEVHGTLLNVQTGLEYKVMSDMSGVMTILGGLTYKTYGLILDK
jgi:hypothetical protein